MKPGDPRNNCDRIHGELVWTGHPRRVYSSVCRSLSALTREGSVARFKIGITNHPHRRFAADADVYDEMILLYRSDSIQNVSEMEAMLVAHNRGWSKNRTGGGGGNIGRVGPYFLYVVLGLCESDLLPADTGLLFSLLQAALHPPGPTSGGFEHSQPS
jgi:hypothetical protein